MEKTILKILKDARAIKPSKDFVERSHRLIIASSANRPSFLHIVKRELVENTKFGLALTLGTLLVFALFGGAAYFSASLLERAPAHGEGLIAEAEAVNFQIQLGEARYFNESAEEIAILLREIKGSNGESVDELLDKLIF
jgi:hypothetical protein